MHQANKIILTNVAIAADLDLTKVPMQTLSKYGNQSSASIPCALCDCLKEELARMDLSFQSQLEFPIIYKGKSLEKTFRIDLLVEDKIIIELKAVEQIQPVHEVQLLTYLRLTNKRLGLLINFNVPVLRKGICRVINGKID